MNAENLAISPAALGLFDPTPEEDYDKLTALGAQLLDAPITLVSIIDDERDRQLFKSRSDACDHLCGVTETPLDQSYCKIVQNTRELLAVSDARSDERVAEVAKRSDLGLVAYLGAPVFAPDGEPLGSFCVVDFEVRNWTDDDKANVRRLADAASDQILLRAALKERDDRLAELEHEIEARREVEKRLRELATTDALTGVLNRRALMEKAESERMRAERYGHRMGVAIVDLDHFKRVNDEHGHETGDKVLEEVSARLSETIRDRIDIVARLGGEEFCLLFPESEPERMLQAAERLRAALAGAEFADGLTITASVGVTVTAPSDETLQDVLRRADDALYAAKDAGRDCVRAAWAENVTDTPEQPEALEGQSGHA